MKVRILINLGWVLMMLVFPVQSLLCQSTDASKQIASAIEKGNAQELDKYFNSMVDISIPGIEDSYGKTQAIRIIQDFFSRYPVKIYKTIKTGNSNDGSQFAIGKLESGTKSFRVFYLMKKLSDKYLIHQFQIQEENKIPGAMDLDSIIDEAIREDIGDGDHTTLAIFPKNINGSAQLKIKDAGILAGMDLAGKIFHRIDSSLTFIAYKQDGEEIKVNDIAFKVKGSILSILSSERLVLNFMQRLSGIATETHNIVSLLKGLNTKILDTRKTTPNLRELEKYAVRVGGGYNHRMGLYDMILIKDNHIDFSGGVVQAIEAVHVYLNRTGKKLKVEIEVRDFDELADVLNYGMIDRILFDNFTPGDLHDAVILVNRQYETEASGGINITNVRDYAETGVDFISIGAITHKFRSLDMSLKAVKPSIWDVDE